MEIKQSFWDGIFGRLQIIEVDSKFHGNLKENKQPYGGYMELSKPQFMIRDLDVIRSVCVKDFDHFVDHRDFSNSDLDRYSGKMLFFMAGEPWKQLRAKMSPTFTTGKIRRMFSIIENCGGRLGAFLEAEIKKSPTTDMTVAFGKYTVDVISSAAFGLESGAFRERKSKFEMMAERLQFNITFQTILKFLTIILLPKLARLLRLSFFDAVACKFFGSTIETTIRHRDSTGEKRDDFLQLMLEARTDQLKPDEAELSSFEKDAILNVGKEKQISLTEDVICAQSILFFLAGFDTTQSLLLFATYQLAISPEIQDKLAEEVEESFEQNGGKFTYESVHEMEFMEKFISGNFNQSYAHI